MAPRKTKKKAAKKTSKKKTGRGRKKKPPKPVPTPVEVSAEPSAESSVEVVSAEPVTEIVETAVAAAVEEDEVITIVEVELRETIFDMLACEAKRREMSPAECAAVVLESGLTIPEGVTTVACGNLISGNGGDDRDPENDAFLEDPDFQESYQRMVRS
jgi:hypothetical protein